MPEFWAGWAQKGISLYKLGRYDESLIYLKEASNKCIVPDLKVMRYISLAEQALALQTQSQK
jgi:tetratricopeptide (TPR) repeat protein